MLSSFQPTRLPRSWSIEPIRFPIELLPRPYRPDVSDPLFGWTGDERAMAGAWWHPLMMFKAWLARRRYRARRAELEAPLRKDPRWR